MISGLIVAADDLAQKVHSHKLEEIDKRIAEVQASDLSDPDVAKSTFDWV